MAAMLRRTPKPSAQAEPQPETVVFRLGPVDSATRITIRTHGVSIATLTLTKVLALAGRQGRGPFEVLISRPEG
jgi:hypothetical protein